MDSTEIFDPASGTWSPGAVMTEPRFVHTTTVLKDGSVLIAGGHGVERLSNTAEMYQP